MTSPNPQDPNDPMYQFIDTQPIDTYPVDPPAPDTSLSHFTTRQYVPEYISNALPIVVTLSNHGLKNGQALRATQFITSPVVLATGMEQINNCLFYIQMSTTNTFQLWSSYGLPIDGRNFTPYVSGGQFTLVGQDLEIVNPSYFPPAGMPPFPPV